MGIGGKYGNSGYTTLKLIRRKIRFSKNRKTSYEDIRNKIITASANIPHKFVKMNRFISILTSTALYYNIPKYSLACKEV